MKRHSVLLPVLCASAGLMLLTGCSDSPNKVVKKYIEAVEKGDDKTAVSLVTGDKMKEKAEEAVARTKGRQAEKNAKFSNPVITDDIATVDVTTVSVSKMYLKKIDGKWKVVSDSEAKKGKGKSKAKAADED